MEQIITIKHINGLKSAKAKFGESSDLSHELTFDVLLAPGDLERLLLLFKQRLPGTTIVISNPQSRMDLLCEVVTEEKAEAFEPIPGPTPEEEGIDPGHEAMKADETIMVYLKGDKEISKTEAFNENGTLKKGVIEMPATFEPEEARA